MQSRVPEKTLERLRQIKLNSIVEDGELDWDYLDQIIQNDDPESRLNLQQVLLAYAITDSSGIFPLPAVVVNEIESVTGLQLAELYVRRNLEYMHCVVVRHKPDTSQLLKLADFFGFQARSVSVTHTTNNEWSCSIEYKVKLRTDG